MSNQAPRVALFATCLVDLFRPSIGFAAAKLIEESGCEVEVPHAQTCCGQPAYNSGDRASTVAIARRTIEALLPFDYVVVPSGSCAGMLKKHYPLLFEADDPFFGRAKEVASKTHELISFLVDVRGMESVDAAFEGVITYHDACSGLRELKIKRQPRRLLESVRGLQVSELDAPDVCCGFGGTFCVKYPEISTRMVGDKVADIEGTGADTVLAGDLGCLMNIAGRLKRTGSKVEARHVAEVLAGELSEPPIAAPRA